MELFQESSVEVKLEYGSFAPDSDLYTEQHQQLFIFFWYVDFMSWLSQERTVVSDP